MIDPTKYGPVVRVAAGVGIPSSTLESAARRGDVETVETYGGLVLVSVASARRFAKQRPKRGRPRKRA